MSAKDKRPIISMPITSREIGLEIMAVVGLALGLLVLAAYWHRVPQTIPTHFGPSGKPDAEGSRSFLLIFPVISIVMYAVFTVISRFPHTYNYPVRITEENAERQYKSARSLMYWMKAEIVWLFTYLQWATIRVSLGRAAGLDNVVIFAATVVLLGTAAIHLIRSYCIR